ncbi:CaiB/BaiF CoA transferase family protein [Acuticoccus sp.]|uniref:CaiB/BaiF CoA transferase family protein n=1 Tax=Acuticoccus sp. TaxID=1904378 RepID=UPI003B51F9AC
MFEPLKDVRVVDLSQILAGPYATYQLALLGAEVIKIEKPGEGDWTRRGGALTALADRQMALDYLTHNAAKKSVTINLKTAEGLELIKALIATADIFVENYRPGVAERLGLSFEAVREVKQDIVYCSVSAYGQDGPLSRRPAYDHVVQGMCGIMLTTGRPGEGPTKVGAPYIDYATGMNAAMAAMAGLMEARRTGKAVRIDVAMLDTALMLMASLMSQHLSAGWKPVQNGNEAWSRSPSSGAFKTTDGLLMLAANNDSQFRKLCTALDRADIATDSRFTTPRGRAANADCLRQMLDEIFATETAAHWEEVLARADVPAARVRTLDEVLAEDQVRSRALVSEHSIEGHDGTIHIPNRSFKVDGEPGTPTSPPSALGADTDEVLQAAGISTARLGELRRAGVI